MPAERIAMRLVREILRLITAEQLSVRETARRTGKAPSTVRATLGRLRAAGLSWPLPEELGDAGLEERLYGKGGAKPGPARRTEPDWASVHRELKRKHVTLSILWEEYIAQQPDGLRYSRFCELYRTFAAKLPVVMRQTHAAGEKLFVDYAGDTVPVVVDRLTGEWRPAQIFVAVLGASSLSYAEATWTQSLPDWIAAHAHALEAIGGVPKLLVPDNTKVAVIKACFYDPQVQRTYAAFAEHYDTGVLPARPRKPRDKAKVEVLRPDYRALSPGPPAPPDVLRPCRVEPGHPGDACRYQRPPSAAPPWRHPPAVVRGTGPPGAQASARGALRLYRMADTARRARLSCRGRGPLL